MTPDGHYFAASGTMYNVPTGEEDADDNPDIKIESMHFLGESLLICILSNQDIRVFYTQQFMYGMFECS